MQVAASITVIHHLEPHDQDAAVAELARVVRPGAGSALVIALLDTIPSGAWCYNRSRKDWLRLFHTHGFQPSLVLGEEYISLAYLIRGISERGPQNSGGGRERARRTPSAVAGSGPTRTLLRGALRRAVAISHPVEATFQRLPGTLGATGLSVTLVLSSRQTEPGGTLRPGRNPHPASPR